MKAILSLKVITLFLSFFILSSHANATLIEFEISQSGWEFGGVMEGRFIGEDMNGDGHLTLSYGEIFSFDVSFSGNSVVDDFTHSLSDLMFFDYTIGTEGFRPSYPLYSYNGDYRYDADDYSIMNTDYSVWIFSSENAIVREVPAPTTISLIIISLGLLRLNVKRHNTSLTI